MVLEPRVRVVGAMDMNSDDLSSLTTSAFIAALSALQKIANDEDQLADVRLEAIDRIMKMAGFYVE